MGVDFLSLLKLFLNTYMDWVREGANKNKPMRVRKSPPPRGRPYSKNRTCLQLIVFFTPLHYLYSLYVQTTVYTVFTLNVYNVH